MIVAGATHPPSETHQMPSRTRKLLLTAAVLGSTVAVAGVGVFAAFTATTSNTGNSIASGTVNIAQSGTGAALYVLPNQGPGATTQRCLRVTYSGSLGATVKMYLTGPITNGTAFNIQIERGSGLTGTWPACTGFVSAASLYNGTLGAFPTTYAAGFDAKGSAWATGNTTDYRLTITVVDDPTPNAHRTSVASGDHSFTWEARNN